MSSRFYSARLKVSDLMFLSSRCIFSKRVWKNSCLTSGSSLISWNTKPMNSLWWIKWVLAKAYHKSDCILVNVNFPPLPKSSGLAPPGIYPPFIYAAIISSIFCWPPIPTEALSSTITASFCISKVSGQLKQVEKYLAVIVFISLMVSALCFLFAMICFSKRS